MKKIKILYVDDELTNLKLFEITFRNIFEVITAENGAAGLEMLEKNSDIDVIVSDMKMPGMNGIEFIKKAKVFYPNIKYFILTGFEITEEISDALQDKLIIRCFGKPFNKIEIENTIMQSMKGK